MGGTGSQDEVLCKVAAGAISNAINIAHNRSKGRWEGGSFAALNASKGPV